MIRYNPSFYWTSGRVFKYSDGIRLGHVNFRLQTLGFKPQYSSSKYCAPFTVKRMACTILWSQQVLFTSGIAHTIQLQVHCHYTQEKPPQMMGFMFSEQNAEINCTSVHIAEMEPSGLGEDESLSGTLLRAAGRAALLPASTQPAAIHSSVLQGFCQFWKETCIEKKKKNIY